MREAHFHWHQLPSRVSSSPPVAPHPSDMAKMRSPSPSQFSHPPSPLPSFVTQFMEAGSLWIIYYLSSQLPGCKVCLSLMSLGNNLTHSLKIFFKENGVCLLDHAHHKQIRWCCRGLRLQDLLLPRWKSTMTNMNIAFHTNHVGIEWNKDADYKVTKWLVFRICLYKLLLFLQKILHNWDIHNRSYYSDVHRFKSFVVKITKCFFYKIIWKPSTWQSGML